MTPLLGLTQYCLGAVVFTLNPTLSFDGLRSVSLVVTTSENGPKIHKREDNPLIHHNNFCT